MPGQIPFFGMPRYRTVWRWHFYAGLYCVPFVIFLAISGAIYLFEPQIEAWIESPYDGLDVSGSPQSPSSIVRAAEQNFPDSAFRYYELPPADDSAARVVLLHDKSRLRTFVHPDSLEVLHAAREEDKFMRVVRRLHGELWMGENGSHLVELAACWTVVLVLTGLFLWWPRNSQGFAGVLYPRLRSGSKNFWRDLHSVTGMWVSWLVLLLVVSGLPWANFWGEYFGNVRKLTNTASVRQSWSTRSAFRDEPPAEGYDLNELDRVVATAVQLGLPAPVQIAPPAGKSKNWTVLSQTPNRPQRVTCAVDGKTGEVLSRHGYADQHPIDRVVSVGIAFHEGQLFGWPNQLLGVLATVGLVMLSVSGVVLWWKRRQPAILGAPEPPREKVLSIVFLGFVVLLGVAMPMFGASLIAVLLIDRFVLSRFTSTRKWLGLATAIAAMTITGCGSDAVETGGTEATIQIAGEPVLDMQVKVFSMQNEQPVELGFAISKADGKLEFIKQDVTGPLYLEAGEYRFTAASAGAPIDVPKEYADPKTTPLKVSYSGSEPIVLTLPAPKRAGR